MGKQKRKMVRQGTVVNDKPEPIVEGYIAAAHAHSCKNRCEIERSKLCGCFYCLLIFPATEVGNNYLAVEDTAMCPRCGIDSVIGSASGIDLTPEFLRKMHDFWF
ncbi:MAG TPA: cytoplasmic protein [Candidatus Angelobacter sp.]|jgi:hypothetical protein